jgi:hypothetical protein
LLGAGPDRLLEAVRDETTIAWYQTKRLTYELQYLADITVTHWTGNPDWSIHWRRPRRATSSWSLRS